MSYAGSGSPGDDPSGYTLEGAKARSVNCQLCQGQGLAMIYNPNYDGSAVGYEFNRRGDRRQVAMRTTAYCLCPAGRKIMMLHQSSPSKLLMHDIHDVIAGKYHNWVADDPTYDPNQTFDIESLPDAVKRLAKAMRVPRIYEPEEPSDHDRINRMFDDSEAI